MKLLSGVLAGLACSLSMGGLLAQQTPSRSHPQQLGRVDFPISCRPAVAAEFEQALALLHSFWAKDAIAGFKTVLQQDPDCAIAYWGIAMSLQQNPLTGQEPNAGARKEALAGLDRAKAIGAPTQRERDYLAAVDLIYRDAENTDFARRRLAYENAMQALSSRYPEDSEAAIFYALSLDMTASLADKSYTNQLKAAAILEKVMQRQPDHPGAAHYLIHSYDYPPIAQRGLPAAQRYAEIAPDNPHALHMPSHIFTRLGMWPESIASNIRSANAAKMEGNGQEQAHAMDYMVNAYLQVGDDVGAKRVIDDSALVTVNPAIFIGHYALAAMPARYVVERHAWTEARVLEVKSTQFSFPDAITHFARGLGYARTGDTRAAEEEGARLTLLRDKLSAQKNDYWSKQVDVQRLAVVAWKALADGSQSDALALMRASADLEDSMEKHIVTPSPVVPARELLGEMLLQVGQPAAALQAFEASFKREPNRFRGIYGAAQSSARAGDQAAATTYYTRLLALTGPDNVRPEIVEARAYLERGK